MAANKNKTNETFFGNLQEYAKEKESVNIFLETGVKLMGFLIFASDDLVIICNKKGAKTYIKPSAVATFQLAKDFIFNDDLPKKEFYS